MENANFKFTELFDECLDEKINKKLIGVDGPFTFTKLFIRCGQPKTVTTDDDDNKDVDDLSEICHRKIGLTGIINGRKSVAICKDDFVYKLKNENENCFKNFWRESKKGSWEKNLPFYNQIPITKIKLTKKKRKTAVEIAHDDWEKYENQKEERCFVYDKADDHETNYMDNFKNFKNKFNCLDIF